jgi:outer membrane cobalamin receptor
MSGWFVRSCTLLVILCFTLTAQALAVSAQDPPPEFELPDVVSPGRRRQAATTSPATVTVLTAAELRRLGVRTVGEALAYVPETLARAYGGPGSLITPSIRGSTAEQVLVLLDGVPINGVYSGNVDLSTIPIDNIERIEVLRGPFSAIYGSGALGGVISIVTSRRARPRVAVSVGSFGAIGVGVSGGGSVAASNLMPSTALSVRADRADGARPNSDFRAATVSLRMGETLGERSWDFTLFGSVGERGTPGTTLFPSTAARQGDTRVAAALTWQRERGRGSDRFRLSLHRDTFEFRDPAFAINDQHVGAIWSAEWQRVMRPSEGHVITLGADAQIQGAAALSLGARSSFVGALYLQDDRALTPSLLLSSGLRLDWNSQYTAQVNPRVGIVYFASPDVRFRLAIGRTFRGPTFADLYYPFDGFVMGNPLLRPEEAWSADAGVEVRTRSGLTWRATAFLSDVRDLIIYVPDAFFVFSPQNVGRASIHGASVELEGALGASARLRASATWLHAKDVATGLDLPNRPRYSGSVAVSTAAGPATLTAAAVFVSARYADSANTVTLPGYATLSLSADVPLGEAMSLRGTVSNVFDARFEPIQGFPAPGRAVWLELTIRRE